MPLDFNFVTDRIATGAGPVDVHNVWELIHAKVNVVIDCRAEFDDTPLFKHFPEINYLWNGTPDWHPPDERIPIPAEWFRTGWRFAIPLLSVPTNIIYCHCHSGIYRGPSLTYAILRAWGIGPTWAKMMIHYARPQTMWGINAADDADAALAAGW